jgi:ferritin-like protein
MKLSKKTKDTALELNRFSGYKIKNPDNISLLIEISGKSEKEKTFKDIQFTAKYLNGLGKVLHKNITTATDAKQNGKKISAEEARKKIMDEFKMNMKKFAEMLTEYIKDADETSQTDFKGKYLELNRESLQNLTTLIYDLSWLKMYYNAKRT